MNPYLLVCLVVAWAGSVIGAGWLGYDTGANAEIAARSREDDAERKAIDAVEQAVAKYLPTIQVKNTTIRQSLEKEIHEKPIFVECRSGDAAVRMLNDTVGATSAASAASARELPASGPAR